MQWQKQLLVVSIAGALAACGGGGGGGDDTPQPTTHLVSATAGSGGTISPGSRTVNEGSTATFSVSANSGFDIQSVTGCGGTLSDSTYTTAAITAACTVTASFVAEPSVYTPYACDADLYGEKANDLRIYQVMVGSFIDGDSSADYDAGYGPSEYKGDLQGVIDSLDYIDSLGVNAIWLTPIFESVEISGQNEWTDRLDGTGYFASNYFNVDPKFGSVDKLKELVDEAHARGIYVFLDGVFGHFKNNVNNYPSPEGRTLSTNGPAQSDHGRQAVYPQDLEFFKEVATYWIHEAKIDGWRLDQAYQVPVGAWGEIRKAVEEASAEVTYQFNGQPAQPLGYMFGEIWSGAGDIAAQGYGTAEMPGLCSNFDFPMRYNIVQTLAVEESGNGNRPATNLASGYVSQLAYPEHAVPNGFLTNHDLVRFGDLVQRGDLGEPSQDAYWLRHKAAYSVLAAYTGPITLYYGEEVGDEMAGFAERNDPCAGDGAGGNWCDDNVSRTPGKVAGLAAVTGETAFTPDSRESDLRDYVAELMDLRAAHPALSAGERINIAMADNVKNALYVDYKKSGDDVVLFVLNTSTTAQTLAVSGEQLGSNGNLVDLLSGTTHAIAAGNYSISVPALTPLFLGVVSPLAGGPVVDNGSDDLTGDGPLADCDTPTVSGDGPLGKAMYIRGTYPGGNAFVASPDSRKFAFKGGRLYQVVVSEPAVTTYDFKFATGGNDWSYEFAVEDAADVEIAAEQTMVRAAGPGTESSIVIPEPGDYVFSFEINDALNGGTMMVSKCE